MGTANLIINGTGCTSGGVFHEVRINGVGSINGSLECNDFKINGNGDVTGNIAAKTAYINGVASIMGNMQAERLQVNGHANIDGSVVAKHVKINGKTDISGDLSGEELSITGALNVKGDCEAELFQAKGGFEIDGLLNAGKVEIKLYGDSYAREIGGGTISVKRTTNWYSLSKVVKSLFRSLQDDLITEVIEGDDVYLEYTKAKVVRGNRVVLGPGCMIETVEYKQEFTAHEEAKVGMHRKV